MVGNDVVDLADREARAGLLHPRFDRRVFAPCEHEALRRASEPNRRRWMLWAAKEAAYKLVKKLDRRAHFSPASFVVQLEENLRGRVVYGDRALFVSLDVAAEAVHAVATDDEAGRPRVVAALAESRQGSDPSRAVRALALRTLTARLGTPPGVLRIGSRDRIPYLEAQGAPLPVDLSLSHHGRFVAFACDPGGLGS